MSPSFSSVPDAERQQDHISWNTLMLLQALLWFPVCAVQASHELKNQYDRSVESVLNCTSLALVILLSWAEWELQLKFIREVLLLSHEGQKESPCSLNSLLERSPGAAGSSLSPRFVNNLCLKDYIAIIEPSYNFVPQGKGWGTKYIYIKINNFMTRLKDLNLIIYYLNYLLHSRGSYNY